jgi:hypothetical protein
MDNSLKHVPCSVIRQDGPCEFTQWMRPDRAFTFRLRRPAQCMPRVAAACPHGIALQAGLLS